MRRHSRQHGPRFSARHGQGENTYVVINLNPEAAGSLQSYLYLFAERAANYPEQAAQALAWRAEIDRALKHMHLSPAARKTNEQAIRKSERKQA